MREVFGSRFLHGEINADVVCYVSNVSEAFKESNFNGNFLNLRYHFRGNFKTMLQHDWREPVKLSDEHEIAALTPSRPIRERRFFLLQNVRELNRT